MSLLVETKPALNPKDALLYASALHMELLLDVTAQVCDIFARFSDALGAEVARAAGADGIVLPHRILGVQDFVRRELGQLVDEYRRMLDSAMETTAGYVQGAHLALYDYYLGARALEESRSWQFGDAFDIDKGKYPHVEGYFTRQRQEVLSAARTYGTKFNLSDRIWNLENGGREKIQQRLMRTAVNKESAASLQKDLEKYLKPDARYTRWTSTRLSKMTSGERLTSEKGLLRKPRRIDPSVGPPTKGMAYNALRLARNEIQQVHWDTYDQTVQAMPWIEQVDWMLSAAHPRSDVCDSLASGGPYDKGSVPSRPHPQCYCWLRSVQMEKREFMSKVRDWLKGQNNFLDDYSQEMGFDFTGAVPSSGLLAATAKAWETKPEAHSWGKDAYKNWVAGLSPEERAAIEYYTGSGYSDINNALRGKQEMTEDITASITALDSALNRASIPEEMLVYRAVDPKAVPEVLKIHPGDVFEDPAFFSTTLAAENRSRCGKAVFEIDVPKGTKAAYVGGLSRAGTGETELLLSRGTKLDIISVHEEGELIIIAAKVTE